MGLAGSITFAQAFDTRYNHLERITEAAEFRAQGTFNATRPTLLQDNITRYERAMQRMHEGIERDLKVLRSPDIQSQLMEREFRETRINERVRAILRIETLLQRIQVAAKTLSHQLLSVSNASAKVVQLQFGESGFKEVAERPLKTLGSQESRSLVESARQNILASMTVNKGPAAPKEFNEILRERAVEVKAHVQRALVTNLKQGLTGQRTTRPLGMPSDEGGGTSGFR